MKHMLFNLKPIENSKFLENLFVIFLENDTLLISLSIPRQSMQALKERGFVIIEEVQMKISFIAVLFFFITLSAYAHPRFCPEAELTEDQRNQIKELREDFKSSILDLESLTDDQKEALSQCFERKKERRAKRRPPCPEAELTEDQRNQVKELHEEFKSSILDLESLTDHQREALSQCFDERKKERRRKHRHEAEK